MLNCYFKSSKEKKSFYQHKKLDTNLGFWVIFSPPPPPPGGGGGGRKMTQKPKFVSKIFPPYFCLKNLVSLLKIDF